MRRAGYLLERRVVTAHQDEVVRLRQGEQMRKVLVLADVQRELLELLQHRPRERDEVRAAKREDVARLDGTPSFRPAVDSGAVRRTAIDDEDPIGLELDKCMLTGDLAAARDRHVAPRGIATDHEVSAAGWEVVDAPRGKVEKRDDDAGGRLLAVA
jgi:hypothetical protein